jgi:hypothetical protein
VTNHIARLQELHAAYRVLPHVDKLLVRTTALCAAVMTWLALALGAPVLLLGILVLALFSTFVFRRRRRHGDVQADEHEDWSFF